MEAGLFPERLLKSSTANVTKIEMAPWQREGLMMFDGCESSAASVQKFAQFLVLFFWEVIPSDT